MGSLTLDLALNPYPAELLVDCESALFLFGAGFLGANDAGWALRGDVPGTVVDIDETKVSEMRDGYPYPWEFYVADAFEFAARVVGRQQWDLVSVDCPTNLFDRCADAIAVWCSLARKAVVLGHGGQPTTAQLPEGWALTDVQRRSDFAGGVYWAVLEPVRSARAADLAALDVRVLSKAKAVVAMEDIHGGNASADVVAMRHDVDDNPGSLKTAVKLARWEADRGYRSTYFILHGSSYWQDEKRLVGALDEIALSGHEIGIHANAIAEALRNGGDPDWILADAIRQLRSYGYPVHGVAPHGDELCRRCGFVNDEMFAECARPEKGAPDRVVAFGGRRVQLAPRPLADFGLLYETYRLPRGSYLSDSGGSWNVPLDEAAAGPGQLHVLMHPDWWSEAFAA